MQFYINIDRQYNECLECPRSALYSYKWLRLKQQKSTFFRFQLSVSTVSCIYHGETLITSNLLQLDLLILLSSRYIENQSMQYQYSIQVFLVGKSRILEKRGKQKFCALPSSPPSLKLSSKNPMSQIHIEQNLFRKKYACFQLHHKAAINSGQVPHMANSFLVHQIFITRKKYHYNS